MKRKYLKLTLIFFTLFAIFIFGCEKDNNNEFDNSTPEIIELKSTPNTSSNDRIPAGEELTIQVLAEDADEDSLLYSWEASGGNFVGETNNVVVVWESPNIIDQETYKITVLVSDGEAVTDLSISIYVDAAKLCSLSGYTFYEGTTIPISGAFITIDTVSTTSGEDGYYEIDEVLSGKRNLTATKEGYDNLSTEIQLIPGSNEINVEMTSALYTHNVFGTISSISDGSGIPDCKVTVLNPDGSESQLFTYTSADGSYQIPWVPEGNTNVLLTEKCYFETQILIGNSDYQYDAEFETVVVDPRDGNTYNVVEIGDKAWMAENLNYGESIGAGDEQTNNEIVEKYCYNNDEENCDEFGGLYQWNEMMNYDNTAGTQGICPEGWHLPSINEWNMVIDYLGGIDIAGGKLKEMDTEHWDSPNTGATNSSGFSALPGGYRTYGIAFYSLGETGSFWSSSEDNDYQALGLYLMYNSTDVNQNEYFKGLGRSVRCVKN